jgi:hypothetical protein
MDQSVMTFGGTAARGSAIPTPVEGMYTHLNDTDTLQYWDGSAWVNRIPAEPAAWTAYTPTLGNLTIGNGTIVFRYAQIGKTVHVQGSITLGSTSVFTDLLSFSLPVSSSSNTQVRTHLGSAYLEDNAVAAYTAMIRKVSDTEADFFALNSSGTYVTGIPMIGNVPFDWATGDFIRFTITYEAA